MESALNEEPQESSISCEKISRSGMENDVLTKLRATCDKLEELWKCIGFPQENCYKRCRIVVYHVNSLFDQLVEEEESLLKRLTESLENCGAEIMLLCEELEVPLCVPPEHLPLLELERHLRARADELRKEKHERLKVLQELQEKEKPLCLALDMSTHRISCNIPTQGQLKELEQHIIMLEDEQRRRMMKFHELKANIMEAMKNLEFTPDTPLEKEVAYARDGDVLLSESNLMNIRDLYDQLVRKCSISEKYAQDQRIKLQTLWQCLKVDKEEQESFLEKHQGYKKGVLNSLSAEVQRCEEIKKSNVKAFVANAREQLAELWDKCYASKEQVEQFTAISDDNYTEQLLNLHEEEVAKWEACWQKFKELFHGVDRLKKLWQQVKEFEKKASDPNRFTNRGGALLQEEKERRKLIKSLPVLEEKLAALACDWEVEKGEPFLVQGKTLHDFISECWEEHTREKENEKLLRKQKQDLDGTRRPAKRVRIPGTPLIPPPTAKRTKPMQSGSVFRTPVGGVCKLPKNTKTPRLAPGHPLRSVLLEHSAAASSPSLVSINYTDFKKGLDLGTDCILNSTEHDLDQTNRANCRSTLMQPLTPSRFACGQVTPHREDRKYIRRSQRIKASLSRRMGKSVLSASSQLKSPKLTTPAKNKKLPVLF